MGASLRAEARSVPASRAGRRTQVDWSPALPGAYARCAPRGGGSIPWCRRGSLVPGEPRPGPFRGRGQGQLAGPRGVRVDHAGLCGHLRPGLGPARSQRSRGVSAGTPREPRPWWAPSWPQVCEGGAELWWDSPGPAWGFHSGQYKVWVGAAEALVKRPQLVTYKCLLSSLL